MSVRLPATVTAAEAGATQALLAKSLRGETAPEVTVDASQLQHFDSAALAVLLACERLATAAGKPFSVRGIPPKLASLATLYGIDGLLHLAPGSAAPTVNGVS